MEGRLPDRGLRRAATPPPLPGHGLAGRGVAHDQQADKTPFAPRCIKDRIEEDLFAHRRDLFTDLQLVFFDTTSIYFEGEGGQDIGQRGFSKDHRPDLYQMVVGAVLDGQGRPICCELWPGNTTDVTTLIPIVDRLRSRFGDQPGVHRGRPGHDQQGDDRRRWSRTSGAGSTSWVPGCGRRTR